MKFDLCVLTQAFYGRFAAHISLKTAVKAELPSDEAEENQTIRIEKAEAFRTAVISPEP